MSSFIKKEKNALNLFSVVPLPYNEIVANGGDAAQQTT